MNTLEAPTLDASVRATAFSPEITITAGERKKLKAASDLERAWARQAEFYGVTAIKERIKKATRPTVDPLDPSSLDRALETLTGDLALLADERCRQFKRICREQHDRAKDRVADLIARLFTEAGEQAGALADAAEASEREASEAAGVPFSPSNIALGYRRRQSEYLHAANASATKAVTTFDL